jgi:hypothetical protein
MESRPGHAADTPPPGDGDQASAPGHRRVRRAVREPGEAGISGIFRGGGEIFGRGHWRACGGCGRARSGLSRRRFSGYRNSIWRAWWPCQYVGLAIVRLLVESGLFWSKWQRARPSRRAPCASNCFCRRWTPKNGRHRAHARMPTVDRWNLWGRLDPLPDLARASRGTPGWHPQRLRTGHWGVDQGARYRSRRHSAPDPVAAEAVPAGLTGWGWKPVCFRPAARPAGARPDCGCPGG